MIPLFSCYAGEGAPAVRDGPLNTLSLLAGNRADIPARLR